MAAKPAVVERFTVSGIPSTQIVHDEDGTTQLATELGHYNGTFEPDGEVDDCTVLYCLVRWRGRRLHCLIYCLVLSYM